MKPTELHRIGWKQLIDFRTTLPALGTNNFIQKQRNHLCEPYLSNPRGEVRAGKRVGGEEEEKEKEKRRKEEGEERRRKRAHAKI